MIITKAFLRKKLYNFLIRQLTLMELTATFRDEFVVDMDAFTNSMTIRLVSTCMEMNAQDFCDGVENSIPAPTADEVIELQIRINNELRSMGDNIDVNLMRDRVDQFVYDFVEKNFQKTSQNTELFLKSFEGPIQ
jgi:hypothetical protein